MLWEWSLQRVCVCSWEECAREHTRMCVFNVNICYFTKLKLASGNAYNCNDRSGMKIREKDVFFYLVLKVRIVCVVNDKKSCYLKSWVCVWVWVGVFLFTTHFPLHLFAASRADVCTLHSHHDCNLCAASHPITLIKDNNTVLLVNPSFSSNSSPSGLDNVFTVESRCTKDTFSMCVCDYPLLLPTSNSNTVNSLCSESCLVARSVKMFRRKLKYIFYAYSCFLRQKLYHI